MFSKLKQIKELRDQAKQIEKMLAEELVEGSAGWTSKVKVQMNGKQEVKKVTIDPDLMTLDKKEKLEKLIEEAVNDCGKKTQKIMFEKMKTSGMKLPGLDDLTS